MIWNFHQPRSIDLEKEDEVDLQSQISNLPFGMIYARIMSKSFPVISMIPAIELKYPMVVTKATDRCPWPRGRGESLR